MIRPQMSSPGQSLSCVHGLDSPMKVYAQTASAWSTGSMHVQSLLQRVLPFEQKQMLLTHLWLKPQVPQFRFRPQPSPIVPHSFPCSAQVLGTQQVPCAVQTAAVGQQAFPQFLVPVGQTH